MRTALRLLVYSILAGFFISSFTACSSKQLYGCIIDYQRFSADLKPKKVTLPFGEMVYLDNNNKNAPVTLVLIHGFEGEKDNWNNFVSSLKGEYRIIVPDLPGQGENRPNSKLDYTIANQSKMLHAFLEHLKLTDVHILGHSMGGAIALQYSFDHQEHIQSLGLVDALGIIQTPSELENIIRQTGKNPLLHICKPDQFRTFIDLSMNKPPFIPDFMLGFLAYRMCLRADTDAKIFQEIIQDLDLSRLAKQVLTPTLILWGKKDRILHVDNAQLFHTYLPNSRVILFDELGHAPMLEDPKKSAALYEDFIRTLKQNP